MSIKFYYHEYIPKLNDLKENLSVPSSFFEAYRKCLEEIWKPIPYNFESLNELISTLRKNPKSVKPFIPATALMKAFYLLRSKLYQESFQSYSQILKINDPKNPFSYKERAKNGLAASILGMEINKTLEDKKLLDMAGNLLKELSNRFASAKVNYGIYLILKHQKDQGEKVLSETVERYPDFGLAHYNLGYIFYQNKDLKNAKIHFEKALKCNYPYRPAIIFLSAIEKKIQLNEFQFNVA